MSLRTCVRRPKRDCQKGLLLDDSFNGALISASTAGNADIGVDLVGSVTLRDSLNGALIGAGAALDTSVSNLVSHDITSMFDVYTLLLTYLYSSTHFGKCNWFFPGAGIKIFTFDQNLSEKEGIRCVIIC
jgi:hypothetical protein